jgi:hypothetical protein
MEKQTPNLRTRRPRHIARKMRSPENKCTYCNACICPSLPIQTQRYKESSKYAIFEEARKNVTTEPVALMYAHFCSLGGFYSTPTEKIMFAVFIEIAVLQAEILSLKTPVTV